MLRRTVTAILITVLSILLFCSCNSNNIPSDTESKIGKFVDGYYQIDQIKGKELMDTEENYIILDVRTEEEYKEQHIKNAILIPHTEIEQRAEKELTDKNQLILVYCRSGNRSKTASKILAELGYTNVMEFGGINSWAYGTIK